MAKRGKKYRKAQELIDPNQEYSLSDAIGLLKKSSFATFNESADLSVRLGVIPKHSDQMVRGTVVLPHGTGKKKRVCVVATGEKVKEAEQAGADFVGGEELLEKISSGWLDFDVLIATPDIMRGVSKLGRILGPRGLMPTPKAGTVTFELKQAIEETKAGRIEFKVDKSAIINSTVGKVSFPEDKLADNIMSLLQAVVHAKPPAAKGKYIRSIHLCSTMGPSIKISESVLEK